MFSVLFCTECQRKAIQKFLRRFLTCRKEHKIPMNFTSIFYQAQLSDKVLDSWKKNWFFLSEPECYKVFVRFNISRFKTKWHVKDVYMYIFTSWEDWRKKPCKYFQLNPKKSNAIWFFFYWTSWNFTVLSVCKSVLKLYIDTDLGVKKNWFIGFLTLLWTVLIVGSRFIDYK